MGLRRAAEAGFEHLLVCNNDLRMPAGSVGPLLAVLRNDPRIAAGLGHSEPRIEEIDD